MGSDTKINRSFSYLKSRVRLNPVSIGDEGPLSSTSLTCPTLVRVAYDQNFTPTGHVGDRMQYYTAKTLLSLGGYLKSLDP